jgi:predicted Fe-Mo cluster-binding NifX family protein
LPLPCAKSTGNLERAETFFILEVEGKAIKKKHFFSVNPHQSNHGQLIKPFQNTGVKLIIVDIISAKANQAPKESGFQVITGVRGPVTEAVQRIIHGRRLS